MAQINVEDIKRVLRAINTKGTPYDQPENIEFLIYEDKDGNTCMALDGAVIDAASIDEKGLKLYYNDLSELTPMGDNAFLVPDDVFELATQMDTCLITPITPGQTFENGELHWYPITRINTADSGDPVYAYIYKADLILMSGGMLDASYGCAFIDTIFDEQDPQPMKVAIFMPLQWIIPNQWSVSQYIVGNYTETRFHNEDTGAEHYIINNLINGSPTIGNTSGSGYMVDLAQALINYDYINYGSLPVANASSPAFIQYSGSLYWKKKSFVDSQEVYEYIQLS